MATQKLNLTRDQLATFLKNHEQIKQFERLFALADEVAPATDTQGISIQAGNADAAATEALAQIVRLAQDAAINSGAADQKALQALDTLGRIANALEMLATAPVIQNNNSVVTDYIDLPEIGPHVSKERRVQWNRDDGTMDVDLYGGSVLQVGQEIHYYAKNTSGSLIANGTPVMFTGTVGSSGKLEFGLAVANGSVPADYMMGVATQDIDDNAFGYITSFGLVRGFNTTGTPYGEVWADGDLLYFDPATPGTWTNVEPAAPNIAVPVAVVVNAGPGGSGSIFVRMKVSEKLTTLQDVYINGGGPLAGQMLIYDQAQSRWENHYLTAGTGISVSNGAGSITVTNSAPDQTVSLTAGTGISTSGTYPSFTITNSAPDQTVALTAGTGISTSGTYPNFTITNSAPDQTVSLTGAGTTSISGTYPSFTITSNDQYTGTVTSVGGTGTVNGISLSGTVTSSGNLTLGGTLSGVDLTTQVTGTLPIANGGTGQTTATAAFNALAPSQSSQSGKYLTTDGTNTSWATVNAGASLSNDTSTASNLYPLFAAATSGTPTTLYTSNAQYLFKPSTGELSVKAPRASNGIVVNSQTISENYTIASGDNGGSFGPVSVASGITVTVSSGSVWTVV